MFKLTAMVNFLIIDDKQTSIVCKVYEKMKIGDTFIHIDDKDKRADYKIKKIYGFKEKEFLETVEDCSYRIVIESNDDEMIKSLKLGDRLFCESDSNIISPYIELPDMSTIGKHQEQYYKIILNYKNYEDQKEIEVEKLVKVLDLLETYGYHYQYNNKMIRIKDKTLYLVEKIQNTDVSFNTIGFYLTNKFYIWGHVGSRNSNYINYLDILLPLKCSFEDDDINHLIIKLFHELNNLLSPFHSFVGSNENIRRFSYLINESLPTSIHYINYFSDDLRKKISSLYHEELQNYLICRNFPFNDCVLDDLKIQEQLYQKYHIDQMTKDLQRTCFNSEKELKYYCSIL